MATTYLDLRENTHENIIEHLERLGNFLPKVPPKIENTKSQFSEKDKIPKNIRPRRRR